MKRFRVILGVGGALWLLLAGAFGIYKYKQSQQALPSHIQKLKDRETKATILSFYDLSLNKISLEKFKGQTVLLNFWATWCAPCVEELPALNQLAKHYPEKLIILALSNERTEEIKNFLMAFPNFYSNFIIGNVGREQMLAHFPVRAFPETYILNQSGQLLQKITGPRKWDSPTWKSNLQKLIKEGKRK